MHSIAGLNAARLADLRLDHEVRNCYLLGRIVKTPAEVRLRLRLSRPADWVPVVMLSLRVAVASSSSFTPMLRLSEMSMCCRCQSISPPSPLCMLWQWISTASSSASNLTTPAALYSACHAVSRAATSSLPHTMCQSSCRFCRHHHRHPPPVVQERHGRRHAGAHRGRAGPAHHPVARPPRPGRHAVVQPRQIWNRGWGRGWGRSRGSSHTAGPPGRDPGAQAARQRRLRGGRQKTRHRRLLAVRSEMRLHARCVISKLIASPQGHLSS